jgi:hypothetical protein
MKEEEKEIEENQCAWDQIKEKKRKSGKRKRGK